MRAYEFMIRSVTRVATLLAVVFGAITCSESPTAARRAPVHLLLAPRFTSQAASIYRSLTSFGVTIDNVHVTVVGAATGDTQGPVLADTTIAFPASESEITIDIDLSIASDQADVMAAIELRQGTTPYFAGGQTLVAKQGETTTAPAPIELAYVGPGASAASLGITPDSPTLAPAASFQFSAQVLDPTEHVVTDLPLSWSTSDATIATVSQTGLVTSTTKTGTVTITVTGLNGLSQQTSIRVQPVTSLVVHTGADQSGSATSTLPTQFEVQALDANQQPVIGATITFAAVNGAGSVSPTSATTDANGYASTSITLGSTAGTYAYTAQVGTAGPTTRVAETASSGVAAALSIVSGNQQADTVMGTFAQPLTIRVTDSFGNAVPNQAVAFQVTSGQASLLTPGSTIPSAEVQTTTGTDGTASVTLSGGGLAGTVQIAALLPNTTVAATFTEAVRPGSPVLFVMLQQPSSTAQATIPLGTQPKVQLADNFLNPVALAGVAVTVLAEYDCSNGGACTQVSAPRPGGVLLDRTAVPGTPTRTLRSKRPSLTLALPRTTRLTAPVRIAATKSVSDTFPQGMGGTTVVLTDANGVASFTDLSLDLQVVPGGGYRLAFTDTTAMMGAALSNPIALSPGPITSIVAAGAADTLSYVSLSDTLHPAVQVIDAVGNGIPGVPVSWSVVNNQGKVDSTSSTTDANGVATPGNWLLPPAVAAPTTFEITATPKPSNIENSPLPIFAAPTG